jgi:excisionase family DNA binding protein
MSGFVKVPELASRWRVTGPTITAMIQRGDLKAVLVGKKYRIPASELARIENVTGE